MNEEFKILIADDSRNTFKIISETIEILGSSVKLIYAENGKIACELAEELQPDLILMDIVMPEMNGIEAIQFLRANNSTAEIPIIVLTATESLNDAWEAGANDFISKPFQKYELLIKVRSALNLAQKIKEIRNQKSELEKKHLEVIEQRDKITKQQYEMLEDIGYSKRIQKAILPSETYLNEVIPQHFILDLPRNLVSGDFYWVGELGGKQVIAVGDCTGHAISGAFMTMAGTAFLNQIINSKAVKNAGEILFELRKLVMKLLKQKGEEGEAADGMDISLVILDKEKKTLQFSGANNPIYLIRNGELQITKGDRMPIGIHLQFEQPFTNKLFDVHAGDMVYLFTDGYADQFGGPHNKKFRYRQFQDIILDIHGKALKEQKEQLYRTITNWKGKNDQVDDILILGFRL